MEIEKKIDEFLTRGVAEVIDRERLKEKLLSGEPLRVKFGIDPTSPDIHLGRSVPLLKLRDLQEMGHTIVFIIGDFTGVIGDTSDKESERPMLDHETVERNMTTYADQAGKLLDLSKVEVRKNSEWLEELDYLDVCEQADAFSLHEFISRENIRKRLDEGKRISLREVLYPLMQGFDSVAVSADLELGGTDQRFNLLAGRRLQEHFDKPSQDILMTDLIPGTDGRKMSSSWGNTINLADESNDMFGKVMSIPDELIESYLVHCTRVPMEEVKEIMKAENPRDAKVRLAKEIVTLYHGADEAEKAEEYFVRMFFKIDGISSSATIDNITLSINSQVLLGDIKIVDFIILVGFASSKGEAKRKIEQGGVELGGEKVTDWNLILDESHDGKVLKVGKKDFVRVVF